MRKSALFLTVCLVATMMWFFSEKTPDNNKPSSVKHHQPGVIIPKADADSIMLEKCLKQFKAQAPIGKLKAEMCDKAVDAFTAQTLPEGIDTKDFTDLKSALNTAE
tara:strand:- start:179 stop:496 length:318 start_codon:yes stop_codon:yes gene_type:complete